MAPIKFARWPLPRLLSLAAFAAIGLFSTGATALAADPERPTPSGLPVPRYVSLKTGQINARLGPGEDYRILWTYRTPGLPVQVIAETREWRRICDPRGQTAWINSGTTSGRRMVMRSKPSPLPMLAKPSAGAPVNAYVAGHALASLDRCKEGWCKVRLDGASGWAPAAELWGTDERRQCLGGR